MILTHLPDLPPRPETPRNAAFRRDFYRRWGRENCIVSGISRRAEYAQFTQTLSIKCVARGEESYFVDRRRVTVSDDSYLVLNEGRTYGSVLDAPTDAYSFSIFFRPGFAREIAGDSGRSLGEALEAGAASRPAPVEFDECLRPHDSRITPVLRFIRRQVAHGVRDENWLEEQCQFLLERLIGEQWRRHASLPDELAGARRAKRAEIARRLAWSIDFMHAHLADEITLADIAAAARLSRFHFLRLFQLAHGQTPIAYLRGLRSRRAQFLIESTSLPASVIAARVGMSRIALWRTLSERLGGGTRAARERGRGYTSPGVAFLGCEDP